MAEYTPTTEQVRRYWQYGANAWMEGLADDRDEGPDGSIGAEFDRWLAAHDREVKAEALGEVRTKIEGAMTALDAYTDEHAETARTALRGCLRVVEHIAAEGGAS